MDASGTYDKNNASDYYLWNNCPSGELRSGALGGVMQVEKPALIGLLAKDSTAVLIDARETAGPSPRLRNAKSIPLRDSSQAKDDGRLPMTDHNIRIFVVGDSGPQARAVAEAIVRDAFDNVAFFNGSIADLPELVDKGSR